MPPKRKAAEDAEDRLEKFYSGEGQDDNTDVFKRRQTLDDEAFTEEDALAGELPGDLGSLEKAIRPGWRRGRYLGLVAKNMAANAGTLTCGLCRKPITRDAKGNEIYDPKRNYTLIQRPHIDHHSPDWIVRKTMMDEYIDTHCAHYDKKQKRRMYSWAMNAQGLQIVHRHCNLEKQKRSAISRSPQFLSKITKPKDSKFWT